MGPTVPAGVTWVHAWGLNRRSVQASLTLLLSGYLLYVGGEGVTGHASQQVSSMVHWQSDKQEWFSETSGIQNDPSDAFN